MTHPAVRILVAAVAGAALLGLHVWPALAACHAFVVNADPTTVEEGKVVQVTVSRDAAVGPSQIDVETIDETARGGHDYEAVPRRTISFTNETSQTFPVQTHNDPEREGGETFRLHLSNPGGCTVNPNFSVGPDVTVTIAAKDHAGAPATTAPPSPTTGARPSSTTSTTSTNDQAPGEEPPPPDSETPAEETTDTSGLVTTTAARSDQIALAEEDDGGAGLGLLIAAAALAAAVVGGGWWIWQRRPGPTG